METPISVLKNRIKVLDGVIQTLANNWQSIVNDETNPHNSWEDILKLIDDKNAEKDEFYAAITILENTLK